MYKIVNDKIYISRGETATYDNYVYNLDGSPMRIPYGEDALGIQFVVTKSQFRTSAIIFKKTLLDGNDFELKTFTNLELLTRAGGLDFSTPPTESEYLADGVYSYNGEYKYPSIVPDSDPIEYEWLDYFFRITFPFESEDTENAEPASYVYEVTVLRGIYDSENGFTTINVKIPLIEGKEFKIGGSTSGR
ncbi:MAG: hypothetical protein RBR02_06330 [Desulfuromonadaceae bacterium]|nr:hypothetical protein [Desulfuromonadaceae bacterium]